MVIEKEEYAMLVPVLQHALIFQFSQHLIICIIVLFNIMPYFVLITII